MIDSRFFLFYNAVAMHPYEEHQPVLKGQFHMNTTSDKSRTLGLVQTAGVGLIALLVHIIINFDVMLKNRGKIESKSHHIYKTFLWCVFVYYIFDILWGFIYDIKIPLLSFIWTELYFISVAAAVFFWTRFVIIYINRESLFTNIKVSS